MSQIFKENRPFKLNLYEAENPEYMLLNSFNDEYTEIVSPRILYWKLNREASKQNQDKLDDLYGEATQTNVYEGPFEVFMLIERSPIMNELTRLGQNTIEEVNIVVPTLQISEKLGRLPDQGDIFRLSMIHEAGKKEKFTFYELSNVVDNDPNNHMWMTLMLFAKQTDLSTLDLETKKEFLKNE